MTRAEFLQMASKCYDEDDWVEFEGQYTLGSFRLSEGRSRKEEAATSPAEAEASEWLGRFLAALEQHADTKAARTRVTLKKIGSPSLPPLPRNPGAQKALYMLLSLPAAPAQAATARSPTAAPTAGGGIERHFARELIDLIPAVSERASKLATVTNIRDDVPESVAKLFEEATKCHLYGFDLACVSLCRALLEEGLKRRLDLRWPGLRGAIGQVLKGEYEDYAHRVADAGNRALHEAAATSDATTEVLTMAREILLNMYGQGADR